MKKLKLTTLIFSLSLLQVSANYTNFYKIESSVVFVKVKKRSYPTGESGNLFVSQGHGVVVGKDGFILVNNALLGEANEAQVILFNDRIFEAKVIGRDLKTDLAILKIQAEKLEPVKWSNGVTRGMDIWLLSAPYNLRYSLIKSSVSHELRPISVLGRVKSCSGNVCDIFMPNVIQYESAINVGSAILFDKNAECVGLETTLFNQFGLMGVHFAIPASIAKKVSSELILHGKVLRSSVDFKLQDVDSKMFKANKMDNVPLKEPCADFGALITEIKKDSAFDKAGLEVGDIIVYFDNELVRDEQNLSNAISDKAPGSKLIFTVWRKIVEKVAEQKSDKKVVDKKDAAKFEEKDIKKITVIKQKDGYSLMTVQVITAEYIAEKSDQIPSFSRYLGIKFAEVMKTKVYKVEKDAKDTKTNDQPKKESIRKGLIIEGISDKALAKDLKIGDAILKIQNKEVKNIQDFDQVISKALKNKEKYIILLIERNEKVFSCALLIDEIAIEKEGI